MATASINETTTAAGKRSVRVVGNQLPGYLLGRPRSFWTTVMAPKQSAVATVITLDDFDLSEIMNELHYGSDCEWAA